MNAQIGLLLPHFSDASNWERLFGFMPRIETLGYDSVWVRDHLSYHPHGFELPGNLFVDPFTTLAAAAAVTRRVRVGTAVLTPFRHPLITAQLVGGLTYLSKGRFVLGIGPGTPRKPWDALGRDYGERLTACRETVEILRLVSSGSSVTFKGELTSFEDVTINPAPSPDMTVWYGGVSNAGIRAAVEFADGILAGPVSFPRLDAVMERLKDGADQAGRRMSVGTSPLVALGRTREEALAKIPLEELRASLQERWKTPVEGAEDLAGALIAGSPDSCAEQVQQLLDRGVELIVVDLRLVMNEFEEAAETWASEVMTRIAPPKNPSPRQPDDFGDAFGGAESKALDTGGAR